MGKINPRINTLLMMRVPEHQLAAMAGVVSMVTLIGAPIGQAVFLSIANGINPAASWLTYGGSTAVRLIVTLITAKKVPEEA